MKNNNIGLFIILILIVIAILGVCIFNKVKEDAMEEIHYGATEGVKVVTTTREELKDNTIWCGTFQLIWNDLKNDIVKQDIVFNPQEKNVEDLNKSEFTVEMLSAEDYYKVYGEPSIELKEKIKKEIKEKFNENSTILEDFNWETRKDKAYFLYTMLKKEFEFPTAFDILEKGNFAKKYENINYFGIQDTTKSKVREQVEVLYYETEDSCAVKLDTKQGEEVVVCKIEEGNNFNEIYDTINIKAIAYTGSKTFGEKDTLKIPNMKLKEKTEYKELENKPFLLATGEEYYIEKALQTIEFEIDNRGGKLKSEAGMMVEKSAAILSANEPRNFSFDDTFILFLREKGKKPYFAIKVTDITKFQ